MLITIHYALSRLEYSYCGEALTMDRCRFRNRDRTQKLGGRKFLTWTYTLIEAIVDVVTGEK